MDLHALRVQNYRCIDDSGWVSVGELTCILGKNESGKTAFMEAVAKLNPSYGDPDYEPYRDYPRQDWPEYSDRHEDDPDVVASARFDLDEAEVESIESEYAADLLADPVVTVHRTYGNDRHWEFEFDDAALLSHLLGEYDLPAEVRPHLREAESLSALRESDDATGVLASIESELGGPPEQVVADGIGRELLADHLPEFRFIGEYSIMDGTIRIGDLVERRAAGDLTPGDQVFLSLLSVAGLDLAELQNAENWREKATELEAASTRVSDAAMAYWSQSGDIAIRIVAANTGETDDQVLDVRVENRDHGVSVEFEQRSRGFRWFFSTFCQLSELERREDDLVLLLDEPGLNLHARAKQEFLAFLGDELAPKQPIVYTTHSPFMIDPENLDGTKMAMADPFGDENVFSDVSKADDYTRFPLRNVFELDLMDTLLVRPQTLLVERKADHVYLYVVSKLLRELGESGLDDRWTVVPIKDARNIDVFVSLFGEDALDVAALLNEPPADGPPTRNTGQREREEIPLALLSEYTAVGGTATIEDVFADSFYLEVVSQAYAEELGAADGVPDRLTPEALARGDRPIVRKLRDYFAEHDVNGGEFDRDVPALYLQENHGDFAGELDRESRRRFTRLFNALNNTLESFDSVEQRRSSIFETLGLS